MTGRHSGRVALVTGASRGIGRGIAGRLVAEGARVCITARKQEALDAAVQELGGPEVACAVAGRTDDPEHQAATVAQVLDTFGRLDLLVNNAGINPAYGPLMKLDLDVARKVVEVNALAPVAWAQHATTAWMGEHGGAIVNVSSASAIRPYPGLGLYGATKAMLAQLTQGMALEMGPAIRVNAIAPAVVKTRFASALYEGKEADVSSAYPLRRLGTPEDVAGLVSFLLSDDAGWITGEVVVIDGGSTIGDLTGTDA